MIIYKLQKYFKIFGKVLSSQSQEVARFPVKKIQQVREKKTSERKKKTG